MSAICHIHSQIIDKEHLRIGFNKYGEKIFGNKKFAETLHLLIKVASVPNFRENRKQNPFDLWLSR